MDIIKKRSSFFRKFLIAIAGMSVLGAIMQFGNVDGFVALVGFIFWFVILVVLIKADVDATREAKEKDA